MIEFFFCNCLDKGLSFHRLNSNYQLSSLWERHRIKLCAVLNKYVSPKNEMLFDWGEKNRNVRVFTSSWDKLSIKMMQVRLQTVAMLTESDESAGWESGMEERKNHVCNGVPKLNLRSKATAKRDLDKFFLQISIGKCVDEKAVRIYTVPNCRSSFLLNISSPFLDLCKENCIRKGQLHRRPRNNGRDGIG